MRKATPEPYKQIALAGNPNVGKSTMFNALTGLHQHTGNWPGKTVGNARGAHSFNGQHYTIVDLPGVYSLMPHSAEEEIAREFLCSKQADATVVVCDATCLERNLNLVLQILEITDSVILCVNLMDEAKRRRIYVDINALSNALGIPVVSTSARKKEGITKLSETIFNMTEGHIKCRPKKVQYRPEIEDALSLLTEYSGSRMQSLQLLSGAILPDETTKHILDKVQNDLAHIGPVQDALVADIYQTAEKIYKKSIHNENHNTLHRQAALDRFLTNRITGVPCMILLLMAVLWLTINGANYPSSILSSLLFKLEDILSSVLTTLSFPTWLHDTLVFGVYRVVSWVVAVMLPPMAIFFPLFTLLEDLGYLPRVAFNLDHTFKKCCTCGKQALTMCMGFGCNAVGVTGCRIIDSPRERLIAILTNSFVPCNGRFPTIISIITMFFVAHVGGILSSIWSALLLTTIILLGILLTFLISRFLSKTILRGMPSSFTLELPPYRKPQVGKIIIRSMLDRTLFVLGRAVSVAAPAGLVIYIMANVSLGGATLLSHCSQFLDPAGKLLGLDGVLLMAFILGLPANEIVMPIAIMAYMSQGTLTEFDNLFALKQLLIDNGWTWLTAICTMVFSLLHWPCSTTLISIKKETGSIKWAVLGFLLPTLTGIILCMLINAMAHLFT